MLCRWMLLEEDQSNLTLLIQALYRLSGEDEYPTCADHKGASTSLS